MSSTAGKCPAVHEHPLVDVDSSVVHAKTSGIWHCDECKQIYIKEYDTIDGLSRSASSSFKSAKPGEKHHQGRISSASAWCAEKSQGPHWYQSDLGKIFLVKGILTRGRADADQWVTKLKIDLSIDGIAWTQIGTDFDANFDRNSVCVLSPSRSLERNSVSDKFDEFEDDDLADRRDLGSKHVEPSTVEWHVKEGFDAFPGHDALVIKDEISLKEVGGIDEMRRVALRNGWGGFVVVHDKVAYFRSKSGAELIAAAKPSAPHVSIHTCLPGASPPSHYRLIRRGYARFVRVRVVSYHGHPSLRMAVMVNRSPSSPSSRRCSKGCDFDVCHRCATILSMRNSLCRKYSTLARNIREVCAETAKTMGHVARVDALVDAALDLALRANLSEGGRSRKFAWTRLHDVVPLLLCVTETIDVANRSLLRDDDDGVQRKSKHLQHMQILVKEIDVCQISSLRQTSDNDCGYYALWNARCLTQAAKAKTPLHCIAFVLSMFDRPSFHRWSSRHQKEVKRVARAMFWSEKNAKDGVLGANECNFLVERDSLLRQACYDGGLIAMHAFADVTLNSQAQILKIDRTIRDFRRSMRDIVLFVLGCVDHWVCFALIRQSNDAGPFVDNHFHHATTTCPSLPSSMASYCQFSGSFLHATIDELQRRCGESIQTSDPRIRTTIVRLSQSRDLTNKSRGVPQILLVESENKRSVGGNTSSNARVREIKRLKTLILDAAQGRTTIVRAALTQAADSFVCSFGENVKSPDGRPVTCGSRSIEHFAARCGGLSMMQDLNRSFRALCETERRLTDDSDGDDGDSETIQIELDPSTKKTLTTILEKCVVEIAGSDVRSFGRSDSGRDRGDNGRMLASMRSRSDGVLWIQKFFREAKDLLRLLGYAEELPFVDFGPPKIPPLGLARSLCKDLVSVKMDDLLELLAATADNVDVSVHDIRRMIRQELSFRPRCSRQGHPLRPAVRPNFCDICNKDKNRSKQSGTSFRCSRGCDFDVCEKCWCLNGRGSVLRAVLGTLRCRAFCTEAVYAAVWHSLFDNKEEDDGRHSSNGVKSSTIAKDSYTAADATTRRSAIERAARELLSVFPDAGLDACMAACERSDGDVASAATSILEAAKERKEALEKEGAI